MKPSEKPLLPAEVLARRIAELGQEINAYYARHPYTVIILMNGGFMFAADLCRHFTGNARLIFCRASSYGNATSPSDQVSFEEIDESLIRDQRILLLDDILDTGKTLRTISAYLSDRGAREVRTCVLLDKPSRRQVSMQANWCGFTVENHFLIGFGLDYAGLYRQLPAIHILETL